MESTKSIKYRAWRLATCCLLLISELVGRSFPANSSSFGQSGKSFDLPVTLGVPGESTDLYLPSPGWYVRPLRNDFAGETDKLMTNSLKVGRRFPLSYHSGLAMSLYWRVYMPIFERKFGRTPEDPPRGVFADWMELQGAYGRHLARLPFGKLHYQLGIGAGHVGPKGARNLHIALHKITGNSTNHLTYEDQPEGWAMSADSGLAYVLPMYHHGHFLWENQLSGGVVHNRAMTSSYLAFNTIIGYGGGLKLGVELRWHRQWASAFFDGIRPTRLEASVSLLLFETYQPTVTLMSGYVEQDRVPQIYLSFLNVNIADKETL